jgi:transcriptional regulator with XRE-family HTH domain
MAPDTLGMLNETACREIRAEMARQSLTQRELAARLRWGVPYLRHRLGGRVKLSLDDVEAIAKVLGVPIEQLVTARAAA